MAAEKVLANLEKVRKAIESLGLTDAEIVGAGANEYAPHLLIEPEAWVRLDFGKPEKIHLSDMKQHFRTNREGFEISAMFPKDPQDRSPNLDMIDYARRVCMGPQAADRVGG